MIKFLPILLSTFYLSSPQILNVSNHRSGEYLEFVELQDNTYSIDSLKDESLNEYRLYSKYGINNEEYVITSVNDDLFDNVNQNFVLMISKGLSGFTNALFDNEHLLQINFTGSKDEWDALNLGVTKDVYYYENDEGFINYWNDIVRPNNNTDVCSMSKDDYLVLKEKYNDLVAEDKAYVDDYVDKANQTIADTMDYLSKYFTEEEKSNNQTKKNLPQDMTIGIIVSVAIFGMTTISIFYILKQQKIIN